ncbi:acylneuraminate cytidylyltransferase family protein [uncultured Thalassospira sp.]|jgi:N-acylneuraminate cytidylyltransferase|uniref:acylneuraminate cytidylyltransferase family protein n=1 Tax=uncultured Thalassospira sp. TaxID=404382 RepID=UPI0032B1CE00|tara:strand:- start:45176 stop:45868 length:693 start_codon:yes stop_codon:yes gene_type:complete
MSDFQIKAVIPARGGSKRLPRKNLVEVCGHPLIAHTIMQARASEHLSGVYVSTDDDEIAAVSERYGAEVIVRPPELAKDMSSSEDAMLHAAGWVRDRGFGDVDAYMMLQCTSPIRTEGDIDAAICQFREEEADSLLSVCRAKHFLWRAGGSSAQPINYDFRARPRSQDIIPQFQENGSFYITKSDLLSTQKCRLGGKVVMYEMDFWAAFEIDDDDDLKLIQWILEQRSVG